MRPGIMLALGAVLTCGCHASSDRAGGDDASVDGEPGVECVESKLRTSGMAEPFATGNRCEFLVVCSDEPITGDLEAEVMLRFAHMTCSFRPDASCDPAAVSSCIAYVGTLAADDHEKGCELTHISQVTSLVCAGDL